ncbi:MAG: thioredoxin family protein [Acidimicrobiales bacterium]
MNVKILGTGCVNCKRVEAIVREVAAEAGLQADIEEVKDVPAILSHGIMHTPGLVVNGELKASGRVPSRAEVAGWLTTSRKS